MKHLAIPAVFALLAMQNTGTPIASTGIPAPTLFDSGDPISLSYPCDASHKGILFYNLTSGVSRPLSICNGTAWVQSAPLISGTTVSIGGALLAIGGSATGTATVSGAALGNVCIASASDGSLPTAGTVVGCQVTAANTVTAFVTAIVAATPSAKTYAVRVIQ